MKKSTKNALDSIKLKTADEQLTAKALQLEYLFEYGVDLVNRNIQITSDIDYPLFDFVDAGLTLMEADNSKSVTIKINSFGGSVYEALAIVGRMKKSKCKIITEGYGAVMSAATLILACGNKRRISEFSWFMYHEASYGGYDKHSVQKAYVKQTDRENLQWAKAMAQFSKKDEEFWLNTGVSIDAYFDAFELMELGVVDEVF